MQHSTRTAQTDWLQRRIKLRGDLIFSPREYEDRWLYQIEDPARSKFFQLGTAEYAFVSLLDGTRTVAEALQLAAQRCSHTAMSVAEAAMIFSWLQQAGLVQEDPPTQPVAFAIERTAENSRRSNPLVFRVSLGNPDRWLNHLQPTLGWTQSLPAFLAWCVLQIAAVVSLATQWERFESASRSVLAPGNWLWLAGAWILLKVAHELSHALAAKRYGGAIGDCGLLFVLFAPLAYVDLTSSWRLRSKWRRIHVASAGIYADLSIAGLAVLGWTLTDLGVFNHLLLNVAVMGGVATIIFNANPLMRFDGYYVLADWLEIPNLYQTSAQDLRAFAMRWLCGVTSASPAWPGARGWFIRLYGIAAWAWRWIICAGLFLAAATLFHGAGLVLAGAAVVSWIGIPLIRTIGKWWRGEIPLVRQIRPLRMAATLAVIGTVGMSGCWLLSAPGILHAPGVVEFEPLVVVRADSPGFVHAVHVRDGEQVEAGDLLAELVNRELTTEVQRLELDVAEAELSARMMSRRGELAASQAEQQRQAALQTKLDVKKQFAQTLILRAPMGGRVMARGLESRLGTYIAAGEELLAIGDEADKHVVLSIAQPDAALLTSHLHLPLKVRLLGGEAIVGRLVRISPRARRHPPHSSLCAPYGGPLPVRETEHAAAADAHARFELLQPRFTAYVELPADTAAKLKSGQQADVAVRTTEQSLSRRFYGRASEWLRHRLSAAGWHAYY